MAKLNSLSQSLPQLRRLLRHCAPELRAQWPLLTGSLLAMFTEVLFRVLEPWPLKFVFDRLLRRAGAVPSGESPRLLALAALALVTILALRALGAYWSALGFARVGNRVVTVLRNRLFAHLQALPMAFHERARAGDLVIRVISDVGLLRDMAVTALLPLTARVLMLAGLVGMMLWLKWNLALMALSVLPLFYLRTASLGARIRSVAKEQRDREGAMASTASESLHGIRTVQALSLEGRFAEQFGGANQGSAKSDVKSKRLAAALERSVDVLIGLATGLTLWYGGVLVLRQELTPGGLLVFLAYLKYAYRPVQDIAKYAGRLAKAAASAQRVLDLLERESEVCDRPGAAPAPAFTGRICFERVTFGYDPDRPVLQDVEGVIPAGTHLAIVGPSGSGKTTLASLLLRFHEPQSGRVRVDGQDIAGFTLASLRAQIGVVLDDTVLFAASVRENIAAAAPGATDAGVRAAADLANAHEFIATLPLGYDTVLGERGVTLSHGQRQRLALARAALRHAPLLILDEPANGLDRTNATLVLDALAQLHENRTVIHITHNPRHAASADFIWYIEGGRIVERGTHDELLRADGHYTALWKTSPEEAPVSEDAPGAAVNGLVLPQATNVFAN